MPPASACEQWRDTRDNEPEQMRERKHRERRNVAVHLGRLDRRTCVRQQVRVREDRTEWSPGERRGVDDGCFLVRGPRVYRALER